jgi:threonine/homoserine/homoserine lactone efflux protein
MTGLLGAGFLLGLSVAAPIGPVGAAVIREGLDRGPLPAFLIGLGAAVVDFCYLALVYLGVAPVLLRLPWLMTGFYLFGALLLGQMGYGSLKRAWEGGAPAPAKGRGRGFFYGLGITLFNPATIVSWLGLGGAFASAWLVGRGWSATAAALLAVFAGSATWFGALALAVGLTRRLAGDRPIIFRLVNGLAGLVLAGFALTFLARALGI